MALSMLRSIVATFALVVVIVTPSLAHQEDAIATMTIRESMQPDLLGPYVLERWKQEHPAQPDPAYGFWVAIDDGWWLQTHTHAPRLRDSPEVDGDYAISLNSWGIVRETYLREGGAWTEYGDWITSCGWLQGDVEKCHASKESSEEGYVRRDYTVTHVLVVAERGQNLTVSLLFDEPPEPREPGPMDEAISLLGLGESEPGPRTQEGIVVRYNGLVNLPFVFLLTGSAPDCRAWLDDIQPGTGFTLNNTAGGKLDVVFYTHYGGYDYEVWKFYGDGGEWGNVPERAEQGCLDVEGGYGNDLFSQYRYTDGLPAYAPDDHSRKRHFTLP